MKNLKKFKIKNSDIQKNTDPKKNIKKKKAQLNYASHEKPKNKKQFYNEIYEEE